MKSGYILCVLIARESLNKQPSGMKRKAHGTQKARHNMKLGESSSTAQRSDSSE